MAGTLWNIGIVYFDNKDYSSAEKYLLHALTFSREIDFSEGVMGTLNMLGNTFYMQDMLDTAINYFKEGLLMANESNRIYAKQLNLECLYNCYVRLENRDMEHYYVSKLRKLVMDQLELNFSHSQNMNSSVIFILWRKVYISILIFHYHITMMYLSWLIPHLTCVSRVKVFHLNPALHCVVRFWLVRILY